MSFNVSLELMEQLFGTNARVVPCSSNWSEILLLTDIIQRHQHLAVVVIINDQTLAMQIEIVIKKFSSVAIVPIEAISNVAADLYIIAGCTVQQFLLSSGQNLQSREERVNKENVLLQAFFDLILSSANIIITHDNKEPLSYLSLLQIDDGNDLKYSDRIPINLTKISARPPSLPKKISVTAVEKLINDPYAYYVHHILNLQVKRQEDQMLEQFFGIVLHDVLSRAVLIDCNISLSSYIAQFIAIYEECIEKHQIKSPIAHNLWPVRFKRIAEWMKSYEKKASESRDEILTEASWKMPISYDDNESIELFARVDRIDVMRDGRIRIFDYKSGTLPSNKAIISGAAPQLPLEALLVLYGQSQCGRKFNIEAQHIELFYIALNGRGEVGIVQQASLDLQSVEHGLNTLIKQFWLDGGAFFATQDSYYALSSEYKHYMRGC